VRCIHLIKREKRDCLIAGFLTSDPHGIDKLNTHNTKSRVQHLRILMRNDLTLHTGVALTHYAHTRTPRLLCCRPAAQSPNACARSPVHQRSACAAPRRQVPFRVPSVRAFCGNRLLKDSAITPDAYLPSNAQRAADMRPPTLRLYAPSHKGADSNTYLVIGRSLKAKLKSRTGLMPCSRQVCDEPDDHGGVELCDRFIEHFSRPEHVRLVPVRPYPPSLRWRFSTT
jgi:hypothetical protein